ncbi:hypothetical protein ACFX2G_028175 [Malus domestica]
MYQKTSVLGPFEGVTLPLGVAGLAGSSSSLLEDGTTSLSCSLGTACYSFFFGAALLVDLSQLKELRALFLHPCRTWHSRSVTQLQ